MTSRMRWSVALSGALVAGLMGAGTASGVAPPAVQIASVPPSTVYAVIKRIPVSPGPLAVAVDQLDDTVYVTSQDDSAVDIISGANGEWDDSFSLGLQPTDIAVNQQDDTVYVTLNAPSSNGFVSTISGGSVTGLPIGAGSEPYGVAIDQIDDTVYVSNFDSDDVSVIDGRLRSNTATIGLEVGSALKGIAVNDVDDSIYVANYSLDSVSAISGRSYDDSRIIMVGDKPIQIAIDQSDDTVYVLNYGDDDVSVINGRDHDDSTIIAVGEDPGGIAVDQTDDTIFVTDSFGGVSIINGRDLNAPVIGVGAGFDLRGVATDDDSDLVYVVDNQDDALAVMAQVSPTLQTTSGEAGSTASISLSVATLPASYEFDDATLARVYFDGVSVATGVTRSTGNTWTFTVPAGAQGSTAAVTVKLGGNLIASAGNFTYTGAPTPPEPPVTYPPSAPTGVTAVPGDGSAVVTWSAPESAGSFPITDYEVAASPAGATCLVKAPALTCEVDGLSNGTAYTFSVRALNGAGWSPRSAMSAPVTPTAPLVRTIQITGSRGADAELPTVLVNGVTTNLVGAVVQARVRLPGQMDYANGSQRTVRPNGTFTWQRKTKKTVYVYFRTLDGDVRSNRVIITLG